MPAVIMENPKYPRNVGAAIRSCSGYDIPELIFTGNRVSLEPKKGEYRLPREERMKGYKDVEFTNSNRPLDKFEGLPIIGIELIPGAMPLTYFEHPIDAVYVFGPEDGSISKGMRTMIHQFVFIPTKHCLNVATAISTVLWDRHLKMQLAGIIPVLSIEETLEGERRGFIEDEEGYDGSNESALQSRTAH